MAWTSFNDNLNEIAAALSADADLKNYCVQSWGKELTGCPRIVCRNLLTASAPFCQASVFMDKK